MGDSLSANGNFFLSGPVWCYLPFFVYWSYPTHLRIKKRVIIMYQLTEGTYTHSVTPWIISNMICSNLLSRETTSQLLQNDLKWSPKWRSPTRPPGKLTWQWKMKHLKIYFLLEIGIIYGILPRLAGVRVPNNQINEVLQVVFPGRFGPGVRGFSGVHDAQPLSLKFLQDLAASWLLDALGGVQKLIQMNDEWVSVIKSIFRRKTVAWCYCIKLYF